MALSHTGIKFRLTQSESETGSATLSAALAKTGDNAPLSHADLDANFVELGKAIQLTDDKIDALTLTDISNVDTTGLATGMVLKYNGTNWAATAITEEDLSNNSTTDLAEGTNLYFTDARARAAISENSDQLAYDSSTGVMTFTQGDTDTVSEGSTNLYFTDARADARIGAASINALSDVTINSATSGQALTWNGSAFVNSAVGFANISGKPTTLAGYGITDSFSGSYNNLTDIPTLVGYLAGTSDGSADQILATNANGTFKWVNNQATSGIQLNSLSVGAEASASGDGGIAYDNTTGIFTYTPPDLSTFITATGNTTFSTQQITNLTDLRASGSGITVGDPSATFDSGTGAFTAETNLDVKGDITGDEIETFGRADFSEQIVVWLDDDHENATGTKSFIFDANATGDKLKVTGDSRITGALEVTSTTKTGTITVGSNTTLADGLLTVDALAGRGSNTELDIQSGTTLFVKSGAKFRLRADAPASLVGEAGDKAGMVAVDPNYIYVCTSSYDGTTVIWKRASYDGASGGGGLANLVDDTSPQLGGTLDLNSNNITTSANNFNITTDSGSNITEIAIGSDSGSGFTLEGIGINSSTNSGEDIVLLGDLNFTSGMVTGELIGMMAYDNATSKSAINGLAGGTINGTTATLGFLSAEAPLYLVGNSGLSNEVGLAVGTPADARIHVLDSSSNTIYKFPATDGTANQVLTTDGNGDLSWTSTIPGYYSLADWKTLIAASTDFADFQSRVAAL